MPRVLCVYRDASSTDLESTSIMSVDDGLSDITREGEAFQIGSGDNCYIIDDQQEK